MSFSFREFPLYNLDYNITKIFQQVEYYNQWFESLRGKLKNLRKRYGRKT